MKKVAIFSILLIIIFLSGCTQTGSRGGSTNGIIIESFGPLISQLEPGDTTEITAILKNVGGSEARDIQVELYGLGDWNPRMIEAPETRLGPTDVTRNIQGESTPVTWEVTAPNYKTGVDNQEFEMRVYYTYSTSALASIKVASDSYIKNFQDPQERQNQINQLGVKMNRPTDGPISVSISAPSKVIKPGSNTLKVIIDIQNVGSGYLLNNQLNVRVYSEGRQVSCSPSGPIKLLQGKSRQLRCSVYIDLANGWDNIPIQVDLENYRYWVSATSTISALPTEV
ncbi:MAG: hypothetical protein KQA41_03465 [Candidatus Aenigmarchaeota archaeon]|nr:hypothetical protein [Candidatus Aenigmarchaeota archaeon]MBU5689255.1 hypothetical protein [Candidatus Aenigmarchaeota archaeon]